MIEKLASLYKNCLVSGHTFGKDEILLKFQYQVLNTVLIVMALFTFLFATLSISGINPLGWVQTTSNYILVTTSIVLILRLRGPKTRYQSTAYIMYAAAYFDFVTALLSVPGDEFRIIWFYLLVFAAYITGGIRAGNIISLISIITVVTCSIYYDLNLSDTAIISSILGLIIATLFIRAYTQKITIFENEIINQEALMISQSRFAAMGEMLSMIAHQWRQPLSTTTLMISEHKIKLMLSKKDLNEYDEIFDKISDTMVYLSDTIDDFQTYFRPDKKSQTIYVSNLVKRVEDLIEAKIKSKKIQIHFKQCKNEPIETYANELIQVFINILNNAIDALVERDIQNRQIWINVECNTTHVYVIIEDNAGGIENDIIHKVFEPYVSTKGKNGTGLGLYMSKMIIENHINGSISVTNTKKGACFTIKLPKKVKPND